MPTKTVASRWAFVVVIVYFWTVPFAFMYFEWDYFRRNTFLDSVFLGPFVAGGKALVWPCFAVTSNSDHGWTIEEKENIAHFSRSVKAAGEAASLSNTNKGSPADHIRLLKMAILEAEFVQADVLAKAHPDLPTRVTKLYLPGLRLHLKSLERSWQLKAAVDASSLLDQWADWWNAHRKEIRIPKDTP